MGVRQQMLILGAPRCFKIVFSLLHPASSEISTDQSFADKEGRKKKKKKRAHKINNYLSILFHHDNKQMVLIF